MKKMINFTIIFVTVLSLTFILTTQVNAAKKVTLTYYAEKDTLNPNPTKVDIRF